MEYIIMAVLVALIVAGAVYQIKTERSNINPILENNHNLLKQYYKDTLSFIIILFSITLVTSMYIIGKGPSRLSTIFLYSHIFIFLLCYFQYKDFQDQRDHFTVERYGLDQLSFVNDIQFRILYNQAMLIVINVLVIISLVFTFR